VSAQVSDTQNGWNLVTRGEVKVDDIPTISGSAIFTGQTVQTGQDGAATISVPGRGIIFLAPDTALRIVADGDQFAVLLAGAVGVNSLIGGGLAIRVRTYAVIPEKTSATTYEVDQDLSGSGSVFCLTGSLQVVYGSGGGLLTVRAGDSAIVPVDKPPRLGGPVPAARRRSEFFLIAAVGAATGVVFFRAVVSPTIP
jgi:hypothetical protein